MGMGLRGSLQGLRDTGGDNPAPWSPQRRAGQTVGNTAERLIPTGRGERKGRMRVTRTGGVRGKEGEPEDYGPAREGEGGGRMKSIKKTGGAMF